MLAMQKKNLCLQSRFFQSPGKKGSGQIMYQCTRNWGTIKLTGKGVRVSCTWFAHASFLLGCIKQSYTNYATNKPCKRLRKC